MDTRTTNEIWVNDDFLDNVHFMDNIHKLRLKSQAENCIAKCEEELKSLEWIKIANKKIYYVRSRNLVILDLKRSAAPLTNQSNLSSFEGFNATLMAYDQFSDLFFANRSRNPFMSDECINNKSSSTFEYVRCNNGCCYRTTDGSSCGSCNNSCGLRIPVSNLQTSSISYVENLIINNLIPKNLSDETKALFHYIVECFNDEYIQFDNCIEIAEKYTDDIHNSKVNNFNGTPITNNDVTEFLKTNTVHFDDELLDIFLSCDKYRAEIEPYDIKRITDPNLGHWDFWSSGSDDNKSNKITIDSSVVGRNPLADIKEDGIIGIDFGTKSTIVVYQDGSDNISPMRIGMGQLSQKVLKRDYENPTVIHFIDIQSFLERYKSSDGRPETLWRDLTVSHTAANALKDSKVNDNFYSYFYDIKQWCGDDRKRRIIIIKDDTGNECELSPFLLLDDDDLNPLELYAYYLGIFINNMRNGIYLDYLLSFPVTYEKAVREKIIESFERGIKKSLPLEVINSETAMKLFRVEQGVSEPAAYAITALNEYGFKPNEKEKIFYGIFDFGGGTTDFDFGIWRKSESLEKRKYDYVIEHFGAGGDRHLGGENLLELLAFEIFKANQDKLRRNNETDFAGIEFTLPPDSEKFPGSETLLSISQKAKRNMKQLMEKVRLFCENLELVKSDENNNKNKESDNSKELFKEDDIREPVICVKTTGNSDIDKVNNSIKSGKLNVDLFDNKGELLSGFELDIINVDLKINVDLVSILENRIESGVKQFFNAMENAFKNSEYSDSIEKINIFLAGNSSKSPIVMKMFEKYIQKYSSAINKKDKVFSVYPPLGTEDAELIQKKFGIEVSDDDILRPTGKTGVAYGLVNGAKGSRIKVISEQDADEEVKFKFYLGHSEEGKFIVDINRDIEYENWVAFTPADEDCFNLYYTTLPEAMTNSLPIKSISKKRIRIDYTDDKAIVYIRASTPSSIEYVVSDEEKMKSQNYYNDIARVELQI